jgi:hypothetical protein
MSAVTIVVVVEVVVVAAAVTGTGPLVVAMVEDLEVVGEDLAVVMNTEAAKDLRTCA